MEVKNADLSSLKINRSNSVQKTGGSWQKPVLITIIVIVIIIAGYFGIGKILEPDIEVTLTTVSFQKPSGANAILTASGYVVAQRQASVASKGTGRLMYLGVVEGDKVYKDQIIARLEDSDIKASLEQARANLKLQQADLKEALNAFERQKSLFRSGSTTQMELDAAEARYERVLANIEVAKAMVLSAEVALENTLIRAPFNGTVLTKNADVGEIVAPFAASASSKAAVVTIADMTSLEVEADVSESNIERITPGLDCEITLDAYPVSGYAGFVSKIVPTADRSKATVLVKVGFKEYDSRVLPEMSAKVQFLSDNKTAIREENKKPVLSVLSSSVIKEGNNSYVYKVVNGVVKRIKVTTGITFGGYLEIVEGLSDGEKIIDSPGPDIKEGVKVKVLE